MFKKNFSTNFRTSKGRLYKEKEDVNRSIYQRDRDRVIHSSAFRRLEHKTQVFVHHEGDHYRSRPRSIVIAFMMNKNLCFMF